MRVRVPVLGGALLALSLGALGGGSEGPPPQSAPATQPAAAAAGADDAWAKQVREVLDRRVAEGGLEEKVGEAERAKLVAAIVDLRRAGERAQRSETDEAAEAARARSVVEADRLLRDTLGYGLAEFVARETAAAGAQHAAAAR